MDFLEKLKSIKEKFDKINEQLSDPKIISDQEKYVQLRRERSNLMEIVETYEAYDGVIKNIRGNKEIVDTSDDNDSVLMAESELNDLKEKKEELEEKIKELLIPT